MPGRYDLDEGLLLGGIDEAGRGPVVGPLVVAGVAVEEEAEVTDLEVRDSKMLTPRARELLAARIKESVWKWEIVQASAEEIDMWRQTMTLNDIESRLFGVVGRRLEADYIVVDSCDVHPPRFGLAVESHLAADQKVLSEHKADENHPVVAAASILAKVQRDKEVAHIGRILETKLPMPVGTGYPSDPVTRAFVKEWLLRHGALPKEFRSSWATVREIAKEAGVALHDRTLEEFQA